MAEDLFLNGPVLNIVTERTREVHIRIPIADTPVLTFPDLEIIRARSRRTAVPDLLIPTPLVVGTEVQATITEEMADGLQELAGESRTSYLKYRFSVIADGEPRRTIMCGRLVVGPIGSGHIIGDVIGPTVTINTGDIVFGDTGGENPGDDDTLADVVLWDSTHSFEWETDNLIQWV